MPNNTDLTRPGQSGDKVRIMDFWASPEQAEYLLEKKQELERELGRSLTHSEFMRLFISSQPDFSKGSKNK